MPINDYFGQHIAEACSVVLDRCVGGAHRWRSYVGDPVPKSAFDGARCYCGAKVIRLHKCRCGDEHLREMSA